MKWSAHEGIKISHCGLQVNSLKQISFKEIIQHYKKQPQAKTEIFRTVIIAQSDPDLMVSRTGDIIEFYNAVFIPTVKSFVLKLGSRKAQLIRSAAFPLARIQAFTLSLRAYKTAIPSQPLPLDVLNGQ